MNYFVPNKKVAATVLGKYRSVQMTGNTFKTVVQKGALIELTVIYGNADYKPGDKIFIKGNCMTLEWTKEEFTGADGNLFILVPEDRIELQIKGDAWNSYQNPYLTNLTQHHTLGAGYIPSGTK